MRPVSLAFLETLTGSHTAAFRLRAVTAGQTGVNPSSAATLLLTGGDVQLDGSADIRGTIDVTIAAEDQDTGATLWPTEADSILTPYGAHELFVERGIAYGGGSVEYVSLGYFRINDVDQSDAPDGLISLTGTDRMSMIIDSLLVDPIPFAAADTYGDIIEQLVTDAYGAAVIEWDDDTDSDPIARSGLIEKRYEWIREAVTGVGKVAYFDHRGILVIKTPPDPGEPVWTVARGERGVLVSASRSLSRDGVYNGVLATGESIDTEPPVRALAVDQGAGSPTLWGGPFGKIAREFASPLMSTEAQCLLAAQTVLRRSLGLPYNVQFSAVPNPALEPDDPIIIGFEGVPSAPVRFLKSGDSFTRTSVDTIGVSETGHSWSATGVQYQVNGGVLKVTLNANVVVSPLQSTAAGLHNVDVYVDYRVPALAAGATLITGITLRYTDGSNYLMARLDWHTAGQGVSIRLAEWRDGIFTVLDELVLFAPYTPGDWWTLRAEVDDDDVVRIVAWPRDDEMPDGWLLEYDLAGTFQGGVRTGMYLWRPTGNTNTGPQFEADNYRTYNIVDPADHVGELHVVDQMTIPLTVTEAMTAKTREQSLTVIGEPS
jgi:hypothetical protein